MGAEWYRDGDSYDTIFSRRRRLADPGEAAKSTPAMLTVLPQQCGYDEQAGRQSPRDHAGGRQWQTRATIPVAMWQDMLGEMRRGFKLLRQPRRWRRRNSKVMNQVGGVPRRAKAARRAMEKYLVSMNLPSRAQYVGMAERLQSIEASSTRSRRC
jgi:hypothetical protein